MNKIKLFLVIVTSMILMIGCESDSTYEGGNNPGGGGTMSSSFGSQVSRNFIGQVVDVNGNPVSNANIKIGNTTGITDSNGVFIIKNASVYERFAYITAKKAGYVDGSRTMVPTNGDNNVKIMLLPLQPTQVINAGVSSEVALSSGTKVVFDGAFQDENGAAYNGSVSVSMYHLLPSDNKLSDLMPGTLFAQDENGNAKALETLGMLSVELRGASGQKLQIASGHTAQIVMKIDNSQLSTAPNTIPLWHFDNDKGYWIQEGSATRQGNNYVGTVSHFSWWNCDAPFPVVSMCVNLEDANGNPLANTKVGIIRSGNTYPSIGTTNADGQVCGLVPANETLTIVVIDNCGNTIYSGSAGPLSSNTTLPTITINNPLAVPTTVEGNLVTCNNAAVTNGYVIMNIGYTTQVAPVSNGSFSFNTLVCGGPNATFTLEGADYDNLQVTGEITYTFTNPTTNVGNLVACNTVTEFISYQIDNDPITYYITGINANYTPNGLSISSSATGTGGIYIWGNTNIPGIYTTTNFSIEGSGVGYISLQTPNTVSFNLSSFGSVGQYIDLTFNGTYTDNNNPAVTHTITGVAHVIRDN
ncbi:carboxypeptidase-like regulatory domain-containing protein [Flavobacterium cerinum]|uniref:Carboxypeptidase-like regulatory domain-containing protein n=1 Tax=Flavobacterium cerinum TaxID=2502784 RepID=A0ABY5IRE1_9FLAO|nr:carboxypeptidase-like regulatory domain-containing protein [Flavobacterium cerinum]UUC44846.1 carboxypeptidase-like regulatory domain-containing protein [Flavobacterium cerinum]